MQTSFITNVTELRSLLLESIGGYLGTYKHPDLPNEPAIWTTDRPTPAGYELIKAGIYQPTTNALEVVIEFAPESMKKIGNIGSSTIVKTWRVYLIFHDLRQDPSPVLDALSAKFSSPTFDRTTSSISTLQYSGSIEKKIT